LQRLRPAEGQPRLRARLAGFGLMADQAETVVGRLSGGQKARLSLLLATIDAPHLLILDEPTNHLDIESREALVEALTAYSGAVILVSHDMHLLGLVADRLWLVKGGKCGPYEQGSGGLSRRSCWTSAMVPGGKPDKVEKPSAKPRQPPVARCALALRAEVRKCEERMTKLEELRARWPKSWPIRGIYDDSKLAELQLWNRKFAEIEVAMGRAERCGWRRNGCDAGGSGADCRLAPGRGAADGGPEPRRPPMIDTAFLLTAFVTLFVIIDPIALVPLFIPLTKGMDASQRRRIALRACLVAAGVLTVFGLVGEGC
jgi:energy-coupling factor transporter ATP-binding protein EcfA2